MGYTVLYIAFGVVALWLLGEVLLQYKARLRWRLLAFAGFAGVVAGLALREVVVICLGAAGFAVGQTLVTLSYRRGFSTGWALGGRPGSSRRRRSGVAPAGGPTLEVSPVEPATGTGDTAFDTTAVYEPQPLEDTGEYDVPGDRPAYAPDPYPGGYEDQAGHAAPGYGESGWTAQPAAASGHDGYDGYGWSGHQAYGDQQPGYGHGNDHGYGTTGDRYDHDAPAGDAWVPHQGQAFIPQQPAGYEQPQHADPYDPYRNPSPAPDDRS